MQEIIIRTQEELDKIKKVEKDQFVIIESALRLNSVMEVYGRLLVKKAVDCNFYEGRFFRGRENCSIEGWENCSIVGRENCSIVGRENCSIEGWENCGIWLKSTLASVALFAFAVCWKIAEGKIKKNSKTATIIEPKIKAGIDGWLESQAIKDEPKIIVFKRVSKDFLTQEGEPTKTKWAIGETLEHPDWKPKESECGAGKYHACSRPFFCDEFRQKVGDRYIAIEVLKKDLHAWTNAEYPHKIAFRKGKVLWECDKHGRKK